MRAVVQRVLGARVEVEGACVARMERGLLVLVGVGRNDGPGEVDWLAHKLVGLRIFPDEAGRFDRCVSDVGGTVGLVSQFTLYADTSRGRRPSFINAAKPELAEPLVEVFTARLREMGVATQQGVFGAHMVVDIRNDGPVTILLELPQP